MSDEKSKPRYQFCPQKDITAYELSQILPLMFGKYSDSFIDDAVEKFSTEIKRHLVAIEHKKIK